MNKQDILSINLLKAMALVFILAFGNAFGQIIVKKNGTEVAQRPVYYCLGENFEVSLNPHQISFDTYQLSEIPTNIPTASTSIRFKSTNANIFSEPIDIGFPFIFYGKTYTKVSVGRNGRVVFTDEDLSDETTYIDRTFSGMQGRGVSPLPSKDYHKIYRDNPDRELALAQIFAGYTDIIFNSNQTSTTRYAYTKHYSFNGEEGLLISMDGLVQTNGSGSRSSTQYSSHIILLKNGTIMIRVNGKKDASYNAILGMQNENATQFSYLQNPSYNNGKWQSSNSTYVLTPSPKQVASIQWLVNGVVQHTNTASPYTYHYQPNLTTEILKAEITYADHSTEISEEIVFSALQPPAFTATKMSNDCLAGYFLEVINPIRGLTYQWYKDGIAFGEGTTITANQSGTYFVRVNHCENAKSNEKTITIQGDIPSIPLGNNHLFSECGTAEHFTFNLQNLVNYPLNDTQYTVKFFDKNNAEIRSPSQYILRSGTKEKITIKVQSTTSTCQDSRDFYVEYQQFPATGTPLQVPTTFCFGDNSPYSIARFKADFPQYQEGDIAFSTDNIHFDLEEVYPQQTAYVKISKQGNHCQFQGKLNFQFENEIIAKPITPFPEHCFSSTEYFDLNQTKQELEYDDVKARFYFNYENGVFSNELTHLHYRGAGTLYIKLENAKGCVYQGTPPMLVLKIYRKPNLIKTTPEQKKSACGSRIFDLTTDISNYIGHWDKYSEIQYYDANHRRLQPSEWEHYNPDVSGQPYMILVYNSTENTECQDTINFDLQYLTPPKALINSLGICDETTYSLEKFKTAVLPSGNYTLLDENQVEHTIAIPTHSPFRFYIKDNVNGCLSDIQEVSFQPLNPVHLKTSQVDVTQCDTDFDGHFSFNLDTTKSQFTDSPTAVFEYFSDSERTLPISSNYQNTNPHEIIYVKISQAGFCPVNTEIHLNVNQPTKSTTLQAQYYICYGGVVEVDAGTENTTYQWSHGASTQKVMLDKAGTYSVTLTNSNGCSYTHHFEISDEHQPKIKQINTDNSKIEVIAEGGVPPYQYSFDNGISWQNSAILHTPIQDQYTLWVKSANGCLGEPKTIYNVKVYNVITPNDDGKNDTWWVDNLDKMEQIDITIVDRYGKIVFQSNDKNKIEWNGKINGRPLPTGTYWYVIKWQDPTRNQTETKQGWILLKNRD